ncbi:hypothetical protein GF373_14630, partial [bacterium]|nr:hypothetical protein [bacterium]
MAKCTDSLSRGLSYTSNLLFKPLDLLFWLKMFFLLYITQAMGFIVQLALDFTAVDFQSIQSQDTAVNLPIFIGLGVFFILSNIIILFFWSAVTVLFYDGVYRGSMAYADAFSRLFAKIISFFLWNVIIGLVIMVGVIVFAVLVGILFAGIGTASNHSMALILFFIVGALAALLALVLFAAYTVILNYLVLPQMIIKNKGILGAWGEAFRIFFENLMECLGFGAMQCVVQILYGILIGGVILILSMILTAFGLPPYAKSILAHPFLALMVFILLPIQVFQDAYALYF